MPIVTTVSYMRDFNYLRRPARSRGALALTQRYVPVASTRPAIAAVVAVGVAIAIASGCATPRERVGAGGTIDFRDDKGHEATLDSLRGKIVVVDLCASWAAACNVNAKVLDEVMPVVQPKGVE